MNNIELRTEAIRLLEEMDAAFQTEKSGKPDEVRLQSYLDQTLAQIRKAQEVDNNFLIALEKFYQASSVLIGLGNLTLGPNTYPTWRYYDQFVSNHVREELKIYGYSVTL